MEEDRQTTEVHQTNADDGVVRRDEVATTSRVSGGVVAQRVVYWIGGVIVALLIIRLLLQLLGANMGSDFVGFIYTITNPLVAPFNGIFGEPTYGKAHFESAALVAIVIYALVTIGIAKLIAILTRTRDA
jgi:uncharacterized protein YggT (Ycf19 family)